MKTLAEKQKFWFDSTQPTSIENINELLSVFGSTEVLVGANPIAVLYYVCMLQQEQIQALQEKVNDPS